jgi:hypothetical protein
MKIAFMSDRSGNYDIWVITLEEEPVLTKVVLKPPSAELSVGETQIFTATPYDQYGNVMPDVEFKWTNTNPEVGDLILLPTPPPPPPSSSALFIAKAPGKTDIIVSGTYGTVVITESAKVIVLTPGVIPANVSIKPETLNLASQGVFTAFIQLPEGYNVADIDVSTVQCGGAKAIRGQVAEDNTFIAKFNRQDDLIGIEPGTEVTLTVTGKLVDGAVLSGSDTIRVIDKGGKK